MKGVKRRVKRGFARLSRTTDRSSKKLIYDPLEGLPSEEEYLELGTPRIIFKRDNRFKLLNDLEQSGWSKYILDKSFMGTGKSHETGTYENTDKGGKVYYIDKNHRNPSVSTGQDNFVDNPVRHNGLTDDPDKNTIRQRASTLD